MTRAQILALPAPLRVLVQIVVPTGLHRPARPSRPHGALAAQRFVWCDPCGVETAATLHGALVRCTEGPIVHGGDR